MREVSDWLSPTAEIGRKPSKESAQSHRLRRSWASASQFEGRTDGQADGRPGAGSASRKRIAVVSARMPCRVRGEDRAEGKRSEREVPVRGGPVQTSKADAWTDADRRTKTSKRRVCWAGVAGAAGVLAAPRLRIFLSLPEHSLARSATAVKGEGMRLGREGLANLKRQPSLRVQRSTVRATGGRRKASGWSTRGR